MIQWFWSSGRCYHFYPFLISWVLEVFISCLREFDGELFESGLKPRKRGFLNFRTGSLRKHASSKTLEAAEFFHETQRSVRVSKVSLWQNRMSPGVSSMHVAVDSILQLYFSTPSNFEWVKMGRLKRLQLIWRCLMQSSCHQGRNSLACSDSQDAQSVAAWFTKGLKTSKRPGKTSQGVCKDGATSSSSAWWQ